MDVTGKKAVYRQIPWNIWSSSLPPNAKEKMVGNWQLNGNPGYYADELANAVEMGHALVAKAGLRKPTSWREFVEKNFKA